jgi:hypothetical protein
MVLEFVAGREIIVRLEDGLIYRADEYDCTGYRLGHWHAEDTE